MLHLMILLMFFGVALAAVALIMTTLDADRALILAALGIERSTLPPLRPAMRRLRHRPLPVLSAVTVKMTVVGTRPAFRRAAA
jgi:hypothetical protein